MCKFDTSGNFFFDNYVGGPAASLAVAGVDGGPVTAPSDYYSFSLAANQSATIALTDLSGGQANLDLEDGSGDVLATGTVTNTNVDEVISNFVAPTAGTYFIHVSGSGVQYSLVTTLSADFSVNPNGDMAHAQNLGAVTGELGAITSNTPNGIYYYETLADGATVSLTTSTVSEGPGQFVNNLDPHVQLEDSNGNVVADGTEAERRYQRDAQLHGAKRRGWHLLCYCDRGKRDTRRVLSGRPSDWAKCDHKVG